MNETIRRLKIRDEEKCSAWASNPELMTHKEMISFLRYYLYNEGIIR